MDLDHLSLLTDSPNYVGTGKVLNFPLDITGLPTIGTSRHIPIGLFLKQFIQPRMLVEMKVEQKRKPITPNEHNVCEA